MLKRIGNVLTVSQNVCIGSVYNHVFSSVAIAVSAGTCSSELLTCLSCFLEYVAILVCVLASSEKNAFKNVFYRKS